MFISGTHENFNATSMPSPLAADGAERGQKSSEPMSCDSFKSAFEYWPLVKQRFIHSPPHNAFPSRPNFLPFGYPNCRIDTYSCADLNNNSDKIVASSPPFSPTTPRHTNACILRNRASGTPVISPMTSPKYDSLLWSPLSFYNSQPGFSYSRDNSLQHEHVPFFHPYKRTLENWKFRQDNKTGNFSPALKTSPASDINKHISPAVPRSPIIVSFSSLLVIFVIVLRSHILACLVQGPSKTLYLH